MSKSFHSQFLIAVVFAAVSFLSGCVTTGGTRIDNIPMYGQPALERPEALKHADEEFIKQASAGLGGREKASVAWWMQGEKYMREGNLDYAMRRYNQSWLLNPNNYQPYWGFAMVMVDTNRFNEAIMYFKTAIKLCNDNFQKVALLSDAGIAYSYAGLFDNANRQFQESVSLDPKYQTVWYRWSQSLYREGNYAEAWKKLKQARVLRATISEQYVRDLRQKMPEPL
jgi:tetratricopeptide (TPR) repeat protein